MRIRLLAASALLTILGCGSPPLKPVAEGMIPVSDGDSLHYRLFGQGADTVVVLHGGPTLNSRYLEAALRPLADSHTLLFYDQRGRGRSSGPRHPDSLSFARDLEDLDAVQAHFRLGPVRIIGHHWGAAVAALFTARHPERVARLVLLSPMPLRVSYAFRLSYLPNDSSATAAWMAARAQGADTLDPGGYCGHFWGFLFSPAEVTAKGPVRALAPAICDETPERLVGREIMARQLYRSLPGYDWSDSLGLVRAPALVIVGTESAAWLSNADQWVSRLPDGRRLALGRTALFPWVEAGGGVTDAIQAFLQERWPPAAEVVDSLGHPRAAS
jgi:proline iminopeptidase